MIYGLTPVQAARKTGKRLAKIEVDISPQLGIETGRRSFTTKSERELEPSREYRVEIRRSGEGIVHLKRPISKPPLFKTVAHTAFEPGFLERFTGKREPVSTLKAQLFQALATTPNKKRFQTLTRLFLSLHQGILSVPLHKSGKKMVPRMRKRGQNGSLNQKSVEFHTAMNNLRPINGTIVRREHRNYLELELHYPESVQLLKERSTFLKEFDNIDIGLAPASIKPFLETEQPGILNIKG